MSQTSERPPTWTPQTHPEPIDRAVLTTIAQQRPNKDHQEEGREAEGDEGGVEHGSGRLPHFGSGRGQLGQPAANEFQTVVQRAREQQRTEAARIAASVPYDEAAMFGGDDDEAVHARLPSTTSNTAINSAPCATEPPNWSMA